MPSDTLPIHGEPATIDHLSSLSTDALRRRLVDVLANAAEGLREAAAIVRVLEERGEDLSEFRGGLFNYLPRIAYGQVLPEVVVRFAGSAYIMDRVAQLPLPEQKRLADGGTVDVVVRRGDYFDTRKMTPISMSMDQLRQVFARGYLRPIQEQIAQLEAASAPEPEPSRPVARVKSDARTGTVRIGGKSAKADEVIRAVCDMAPVDPNVTGAGGTVAIEADQYQALQRIASGRSTTIKQVVRAILAQYLTTMDN